LLQLGSSALPIATEHKRTEERIRLSGIPFVMLRKTCYVEDYNENLGIPLASGAFLGAARDGRIAAAARATAAVAVLTTDGHDGKVYELAGDQVFTMAEHAHEVSRLRGKSIHDDLQAAIWLENARLHTGLQREYGERKRAEQALRHSEQRFRDYAETASDWLWETGPDHVFTHVSEQLSDFGMDRASRIGKRRLDVATDRQAEPQKWREHMAALERHEPFRNFEYTCRDLAGRQRHVSVNGRPIFAADGRFLGYRGTATDLTKQREAEERLRQSEKMDAIGQLTGGVAHDFNNILTVITGAIEILQDGVENRPELAAIAQLIDDAATRGAEITSQLLTFARRQPLEPRAIDVNAMVADTARLLKPILGEHVEIVPVLEDNAWSALVDPSQLSAAIVNLAVNARDAMPGGGKLTLETANVMRDDVQPSGDGEVKIGEFVMIAITDTGQGIPADIRDRVFEPFFTTKGAGRGTGLGLSMVYGFAKQSGGTVDIDSEEGRGTVIRLYLPRLEGQAAVKAEPVHATGTPRGHETILVVEDDALVRGYVIAQLGSLGYSTLVPATAWRHLPWSTRASNSISCSPT
jgi:PAS domain S-box-containing protein